MLSSQPIYQDSIERLQKLLTCPVLNKLFLNHDGGGGGEKARIGGIGTNQRGKVLTSIHPSLPATILKCKKLNNRKCFLFLSLFCYFMFGKN